MGVMNNFTPPNSPPPPGPGLMGEGTTGVTPLSLSSLPPPPPPPPLLQSWVPFFWAPFLLLLGKVRFRGRGLSASSSPMGLGELRLLRALGPRSSDRTPLPPFTMGPERDGTVCRPFIGWALGPRSSGRTPMPPFPPKGMALSAALSFFLSPRVPFFLAPSLQKGMALSASLSFSLSPRRVPSFLAPSPSLPNQGCPSSWHPLSFNCPLFLSALGNLWWCGLPPIGRLLAFWQSSSTSLGLGIGVWFLG